MELTVISKSKSFVYSIYKICRSLPKEEKYVMIPQILRSAISIPSNITEGQQKSRKEFIHHIKIARGSLSEAMVQLEIISEIYKLDIKDLISLGDEIGKMTYGLLLKLKTLTEDLEVH